MNEEARVVEVLAQIRRHALQAIAYARRWPDWRQDWGYIDAICKRVELVGEVASRRFPRELRVRYPQIPWAEMAGMRERLVHDYGNLDLDILEDVVTVELPRLIAALDALLGDEGEPAS